MTKWFACLSLAIFGAGCPSTDVDPDEVKPPGPTAEFDPSNRIIPFPNNLLLDPMTGKLNLPAGCNTADANGDGVPDGGPESATAKALREGVLNQLNGFGTFKTTMNITFSEAVDMASLTGKVHLYQIAAGGQPLDPASSDEIDVIAQPSDTVRFDANCANPKPVTQITFIAVSTAGGTPVPITLAGNATYVLGIEQGVKTASGAEFSPSFVWGLVRAVEDPVTIDDAGNIVADRTPLDPSDDEDRATLEGVDLLWHAHDKPLLFLAAKGHAHDKIILATSFNTQTTTDSLDSAVAGTPAAVVTSTGPLLGVARIIAAANGEQFLQGALPGACQAAGGPLPCQAVGEALKADLMAKQFQINTPNPLSGGAMIPGPWGDPIKPSEVEMELIGTVITTPAAGCPPEGCPTVVFGHGLGSRKETVFAIASQLAGAGFNAVAIDFVAHNDRAIRNSDDPLRGCATGTGTPNPAQQPQCFAPFLSPNLAATRDNIRQSVLDVQALKAALVACDVTNCGALKVDPTKIVYMGISLGGIMGSTATATSDFKASVLNVPGAGWVDILENTQSLAIRCSLVDGLIDAGILVGQKFTPGTPPMGLCLGEEWKLQPGYKQFAVIGRWVLDPADPINFTGKLATKKILIQEVVGDAVVSNIATEQEAALVGLQPGATADAAASATPAASAAITTNPTMNKFVRYPTLPPAAPFPGNTFAHASLLQPQPPPPATPTLDGQLGTIRLQKDAITFLQNNN